MNTLKMISCNSQSLIFFIIAVGYLIDRVACRHLTDNRNQIFDRELSNSDPHIKIDPVLRKALLKALEKLEKEDSLIASQSPLLSGDRAEAKVETVTSIDTAANATTAATTTVSSSSDADEDVQFFAAPLVAAFTIQQDYSGIPKAVIPIFKRTRNETSSVSLPALQSIDDRNIEIELKRLQDEHRKTQRELQQTKEIIDRQRLFLEPRLERTVITSVQRLPTELVLSFNNPDAELQSVTNANRIQRQEFGVGNFFTNSQQQQQPTPLRYHHHHHHQQQQHHRQQNHNLYNPHQNPFLSTNSLEQPTALFDNDNEPLLNDPQQYVNQRLKRLLYFSGFENAHEDLNIVSKVLSLNHYQQRPGSQPSSSFVN